MTLDHLRLQ